MRSGSSLTAEGVALQADLFACGELAVEPQRRAREWLDDTSWIDVCPLWLRGADDLLFDLQRALPWRQGTRVMWGQIVAEPRLTVGCAVSHRRVPESVRAISRSLSDDFGEPLTMLWANWYRDGNDAVAWHGDRVARWSVDPTVAIVSLGGPRRFVIKPRPGHEGASRTFTLSSGDLLAMGGRCQVDYLHAVPRQRGAHPRISLTFRVPDPNGFDEGAFVGYSADARDRAAWPPAES